MRTCRIKYGSPTRSSSPGNFKWTDITVGLCWRKPCGYTHAFVWWERKWKDDYFPAFGDDSVVAIDSDITNEAGLLLRMRLVYCFRGMVNAFLKKAYLGGCCYQRRTGHQVCHPVHLRWAGPKYFIESERWLGSQLAHPGCGVDEQGHREALWQPRKGVPRIEMIAQPEGRAVTSL